MMLFWFFFAPAWSVAPDGPGTEATPRTQTVPPFDFEAAAARQAEVERVRVWISDHMTQVAKGDPQAEELALKFRNHTCSMITGPQGELMAVHQGLAAAEVACREATPFVVLGQPEPLRIPSDRRLTSGLRYDGRTFIYVPLEPWTPWYLGVVALKWGVHWDDKVSGRESKDVRQFSLEWLDGELRAYTMEFAAIDRHTNGAFSKAVSEEIAAEGLVPPVAASEFSRPPTRALSLEELTRRAFAGEAAQSADEQAHRSGSTMVAYYLALAGNDPEARRQALIWIFNRKS